MFAQEQHPGAGLELAGLMTDRAVMHIRSAQEATEMTMQSIHELGRTTVVATALAVFDTVSERSKSSFQGGYLAREASASATESIHDPELGAVQIIHAIAQQTTAPDVRSRFQKQRLERHEKSLVAIGELSGVEKLLLVEKQQLAVAHEEQQIGLWLGQQGPTLGARQLESFPPYLRLAGEIGLVRQLLHGAMALELGRQTGLHKELLVSRELLRLNGVRMQG